MPNEETQQEKRDAVAEARELLAKATPKPWRLGDAGNIVFHPTEKGVAIAMTRDNGIKPLRGFLDDRIQMTNEQYEESKGIEWWERRVAESEGNARLIARGPELLNTLCDQYDELLTAVRDYLTVDPELNVPKWVEIHDRLQRLAGIEKKD